MDKSNELSLLLSIDVAITTNNSRGVQIRTHQYSISYENPEQPRPAYLFVCLFIQWKIDRYRRIFQEFTVIRESVLFEIQSLIKSISIAH